MRKCMVALLHGCVALAKQFFAQTKMENNLNGLLFIQICMLKFSIGKAPKKNVGMSSNFTTKKIW